MKVFLLSLACRLHAFLFSYMTRAGLILCDVDPQMIANELRRIGGDIEEFKTAQKSKLGGAFEKMGELQARLLEVEQKMARPGFGSSGSYGSGDLSGQLRAALEQNAEIKAIADGRLRRTVMALPPGYFAPQAAITSTGITMPDQRPGIVTPAQRRMTIRSLIPSVPTTHGSIQYLQETAFTNNAAPVSESTEKPESNLTFELKTSPIVVLAHWIRVTRQALDDIPTMLAYIDGSLRYGLEYVEELQLLKGSGAGNNLSGLYTQATTYVPPISVPSQTKIDRLRLMILQLELANFQATGVVLHPADWCAIQLTKSSVGDYIKGSPSTTPPVETNPPRVWGVPVVVTAAMSVDTALVGDFQRAALLYDREMARVDVSTESGDDFTTNRAHVRAEERLGLAILRTDALIKDVDLPSSSA